LTFFGLTSEYRFSTFKQIHEIVFHGRGGYDWYTVYTMPNWLRRYTFHELKKYYDEENKATEDAQRAAENAKNGKTASPNVITPPDFTSKRGA
jgi:hypothetical protein